MKRKVYKSFDELPLMLTVPEVSGVLGISLAGTYELARSDGFPAFKIGNRVLVPKDKFLVWLEEKCVEKVEHF